MAQRLHLEQSTDEWLEWRSYWSEEQYKESLGVGIWDKGALGLMTCRIERVVTGEDLVVLCISGRVTGEHVNELRAALEQEGKTVAIDLKDVLLVNHEAVTLLALCEINGSQLRNCPAYVREWVTRERAQMHADGNKGQKKG